MVGFEIQDCRWEMEIGDLGTVKFSSHLENDNNVLRNTKYDFGN